MDLDPTLVDVHHRHECGYVGVITPDRVEVHLAPMAGSNDGIAGCHKVPFE
jgi:hypothetical protein